MTKLHIVHNSNITAFRAESYGTINDSPFVADRDHLKPSPFVTFYSDKVLSYNLRTDINDVFYP